MNLHELQGEFTQARERFLKSLGEKAELAEAMEVKAREVAEIAGEIKLIQRLYASAQQREAAEEQQRAIEQQEALRLAQEQEAQHVEQMNGATQEMPEPLHQAAVAVITPETESVLDFDPERTARQAERKPRK